MDELAQRVRRALQHPASPADASELLAEVHRGARRRRQRRTIAVAVAASVVAVAGTATAIGVGGGGTDPIADPAKSFTSPPNPSETSATELPGAMVDLGSTGFDALGPDDVWRVSAADCGRWLCARVLRTVGEGWVPLTDIEFENAAEANRYELPPVELVRVADSGRDAWAFGLQLWSTHDGGSSWQRQRLPSGERDRITVSPLGDQVFAVQESPVRLWRSPADHDDWSEIQAPPGLTFADSIVRLGDTLVVTGFLRDDRRVHMVSDDGGSTWRQADPPCEGETAPLRSSAAALFTTCADGSGTRVWRSTDGETWESLAELRVATYIDDTFPVDDETALVVTGDGGLLVNAHGQEEVDLDLGQDGTVLYGEFTTPDRGYLLTTPPRQLLATADGGRTWTRYD